MKHGFGALAIGCGLGIVLYGTPALAGPARQTLALCVAPLPDTPDLVQVNAQEWLRHGGGRSAHLCLAQAALALGAYRDAAEAFTAASREADLSSLRRDAARSIAHPVPRMTSDACDDLAQAAGAWILTGDGKQAEAAARKALTYDPGQLQLRVLLAQALALQTRYAETIAALGSLDSNSISGAERLSFVRALVIRASAYRHLDRNTEGLVDVNHALGLAPEDVDALLERGILYVRLNRLGEAHADWERVIALSPDGHDAYLARQDEALLDADPDQP